MDTLFGLGIIAVAGYFVIKWVLKETKKPEELETKVEPAKKIDSDFVTGLSVAKEEIKAEVAKVETAIVEEAKEAVKELEAKIEAVAVKVEEEIKVEVAKVEAAIVEKIKDDVVKVEEKAKAIEAAVEAKVEKLTAAVKRKKKSKKVQK